MGFCAAFAFVGALKLAKMWFPASRFGLLAGITQALGMLGAAVGEGPVSYLVQLTSWREAMYIIGGVLFVLGIGIALIVRDNKDEVRVDINKTPMFKGVVEVLKLKATWVNAILIGFLYAPTAAFAELWGASYIHRVQNISMTLAASSISLIFIGWAIGSPIAGFISDKIKRRKPIVIVSCVMSFVFLFPILYVPNLSSTLIFVLLFCYGLSNIGVATCYAIASEVVPVHLSGTSMSIANMASVLIGALLQPLIGKLLDMHWDHKYVAGVPFYSASDYHMAVWILPLCFVVSLVAAIVIKESYAQIEIKKS